MSGKITGEFSEEAKIPNEELFRKASEEFFRHCVHVMPVDWDCAELEYEGWNRKCPNLIRLLKNE